MFHFHYYLAIHIKVKLNDLNCSISLHHVHYTFLPILQDYDFFLYKMYWYMLKLTYLQKELMEYTCFKQNDA